MQSHAAPDLPSYMKDKKLYVHRQDSLAVEGLDLEKIGIEEILVSKEAEFFMEEHIQNPPKSTLGKLFYSKLKFSIKNVHGTL